MVKERVIKQIRQLTTTSTANNSAYHQPGHPTGKTVYDCNFQQCRTMVKERVIKRVIKPVWIRLLTISPNG